MNHYPHHLGDYAKDTLGLTMLEHGAYRLLLDAYYASEEAPSADDVYAIAKAGTPAERKAVDKVLKRFELRDGRYYHKRVEEELIAYRTRSEQGKKNVAKRYQTPTNPLPTPQPTDKQTGTESVLASSHKPITNPSSTASSVTNIPASPGAIAALQAVCDAARVTADARANAHLRQWCEEGVTVAMLRDAIDIARIQKPDPAMIPLRYLLPIVAELRAGTRQRLEKRGDDAVEGAKRLIAEAEAKEAKHAAH